MLRARCKQGIQGQSTSNTLQIANLSSKRPANIIAQPHIKLKHSRPRFKSHANCMLKFLNPENSVQIREFSCKKCSTYRFSSCFFQFLKFFFQCGELSRGEPNFFSHVSRFFFSLLLVSTRWVSRDQQKPMVSALHRADYVCGPWMSMIAQTEDVVSCLAERCCHLLGVLWCCNFARMRRQGWRCTSPSY